ncbi:MAG: hypothetical protein ABW276_09175, partial [Casimicrobiaceae bacterium]
MTMKTTLLATLGVLALASCATREPMPFPTATDCFYPACVIDVAVVEEGGVRKLKMANDGNVRMGTRHRLTAIMWNLKTPGYEFRGDSLQGRNAGAFSGQILAHNWWETSVSITHLNTQPGVMRYELTAYP